MATVEIERVLDASPERVRRAFVDAAELQAWFWPPRMDPRAVVQPEVDGTWSIASEPGGVAVTGRFTDLGPDLVAWTWRWDGADEEDESIVVLTLVPAEDGAGTHLRVRHDHVPDADAPAQAEGWESCLERLPHHLAAGA